jgi:hypothetical protein
VACGSDRFDAGRVVGEVRIRAAAGSVQVTNDAGGVGTDISQALAISRT